jgi:hypothetical protein
MTAELAVEICKGDAILSASPSTLLEFKRRPIPGGVFASARGHRPPTSICDVIITPRFSSPPSRSSTPRRARK